MVLSRETTEWILGLGTRASETVSVAPLTCVLVLLSLVASAADATPKEAELRRQMAKLVEKMDDPMVRLDAMRAFRKIGAPAVPVLIEALKSSSANVRKNAAFSLSEMGPVAAAAAPALTAALRDPKAIVRDFSADALGKIGPKARVALPSLRTALKDQNSGVRASAGFALVRIEGTSSTGMTSLKRQLRHKDSEARMLAAIALRDLGPAAASAVPDLLPLLTDADSEARYEAAQALHEIGPLAKAAVPALQKALKDKDELVREMARDALSRIAEGPDPRWELISPLGADADRKIAALLARIQAAAARLPNSGKGVSALRRTELGGALQAVNAVLCHRPKDATALMLKAKLEKYLTLVLDLGKGIELRLALIPAGTFMMGSRKGEYHREDDEGPQVSVSISRPFYMGIYEVTQEQYERVTGSNPAAFKGKMNPVEQVSWKDAAAFCKALSRKTGRTVRLPTEAEWEYACRAGTTRLFHTGKTITTLQVNCDRNYTYWNPGGADRGPEGLYRQRTIAVGRLASNPWGLYDMHGNVAEWCSDWYQDTYKGLAARDPRGPNAGRFRTLRGGDWKSYPWDCRSAARSNARLGYRKSHVGFRIVVASGRRARNRLPATNPSSRPSAEGRSSGDTVQRRDKRSGSGVSGTET